MHYLFVDTETSGISPQKHSLLTAYFGVYNDKLEFIDELDLYLKPDDGNVICDPKAMEITGIKIDEHLVVADTYSEGKKKLLSLLAKHKIPGKRKHYRLCGHNIDFDKHFLFAQFIDQDEWEKLVHYNTIDTLRVCTFLQDVGIIPNDLGQLSALVEFFNIPMGNAHNAKEDIKMTVEVYRAMKKMMENRKLDMIGNIDSSLLSIVEMT